MFNFIKVTSNILFSLVDRLICSPIRLFLTFHKISNLFFIIFSMTNFKTIKTILKEIRHLLIFKNFLSIKDILPYIIFMLHCQITRLFLNSLLLLFLFFTFKFWISFLSLVLTISCFILFSDF
jgi:hypothetical protein